MKSAVTALHRAHLSKLLAPIETLLDENNVTEVLINGPTEVFYERGGRLTRAACRFSDSDALTAVVRAIAQFNGVEAHAGRPILEGRLPDGSRVEAVLPPAAPRGPMIAVRRFASGRLELDDLVSSGCLSTEAAEYLCGRVEQRANVLVAGGTGSGKSSLLNVLSARIPDDQRVVVIEDACELQLRKPHLVQLQTCEAGEDGPAVSIRDLLRATLRLRPDRIVVGEIRGTEALDLVHAMTSGHGGGLSTVHASHPFDALARIETFCLMADASLNVAMLRPQIASALDLVVQMERAPDGRRRVTHICDVDGFGATGFRVTDRFALDDSECLRSSAASGGHPS